ncbi:MAG: ATP synthase F0 subunit B [Deltaproteobacteria bacterium]|nr:ATP synthase F0 subunit B [Deltaproteobacteria bacterium]
MIDLDYTLFIQLILFVVLVVSLKFILFDPYLKRLKKRDEVLVGYRKEAEEINRRVEELSKRFDELVKSAREEARAEYEKIKDEANLEREEIIHKARLEVAEIIEKGRESLRRDKEKIMAEASIQVDMISKQIAEKILKGQLK